MAYSMASRKDMPQFLSKLHPKYATPYYSIWIAGTAMALLVLFVDLSRVVAMSTFAMLFYYTLANICALKMRTVKRVYPKTVPFLGALSCCMLLAFTLFASPQAWIVSVGVLTVGAVFYLLKNASLQTSLPKRTLRFFEIHSLNLEQRQF